MHSLHEPTGLSVSVEHNFGISIPAIFAALKTDVFSGTDTSLPSISTVINFSLLLGGVPKSSKILQIMSNS